MVELQVRVDEEPEVIDVGLADSWTVGIAGAAVTVTRADCVADPAVPVQVNVYVALLVRDPVLCEPDVAFVPDHAPEAVQEVAFVDVQLRVDEDPEVRELGFAVNWTVGSGLAAPKFGL